MRTWNDVELTDPYSYVKGLQYKNHFSPGKLTQYICLDSLVYPITIVKVTSVIKYKKKNLYDVDEVQQTSTKVTDPTEIFS